MKNILFPTGQVPKLDKKGNLIIPEHRLYYEIIKKGYPITAKEYLFLFYYYTDKSECKNRKILDRYFKIHCSSVTTAWRTKKSLEKKKIKII